MSPDRVSPIKRSEGFLNNSLAMHYCKMADDNLELLLLAQIKAFDLKVDSEWKIYVLKLLS